MKNLFLIAFWTVKYRHFSNFYFYATWYLVLALLSFNFKNVSFPQRIHLIYTQEPEFWAHSFTITLRGRQVYVGWRKTPKSETPRVLQIPQKPHKCFNHLLPVWLSVQIDLERFNHVHVQLGSPRVLAVWLSDLSGLWTLWGCWEWNRAGQQCSMITYGCRSPYSQSQRAI